MKKINLLAGVFLLSVLLSDTVYAVGTESLERYRSFALVAGLMGFSITTALTWIWYSRIRTRFLGFFAVGVSIQLLIVIINFFFQPWGVTTLELFRNFLELISAVAFTWGTWTVFKGA
jgi:glucan phosphoethanolaminetransferase (alkaline phosphatase superfamily)